MPLNLPLNKTAFVGRCFKTKENGCSAMNFLSAFTSGGKDSASSYTATKITSRLNIGIINTVECGFTQVFR